ncbi:MAG TPA: DUF58 domain-containing protein [Acidimicrobiales bacterium]|nr:DUF58 domain-containing protein [Acidimicrobiales bacterium]
MSPSGTAPPRVAGAPAEEVLRRLQIDVTRRLDGMLHGDFEGLVPGRGSDPGDTRAYTPGDDVRRIDWNVTARMPEVHVRETIADRELATWVLLDRSASLDFGTATCEKRDMALAATAAIGFITLRTGNRLGVVVAGDGDVRVLPPGTGRRHLLGTLHAATLASAAAGGSSVDLAAAIDALARAGQRRRGLMVVVSDFLAPGGWERSLRGLASRHEVLAVEVVDPRELALPDVGVIELVDPETGAQREIHTSRDLRERYATAAGDQRQDIARRVRAAGSDHLVLRTDRDWLLDIVRFVSRRKERRRVAAGTAHH